MFTVPAVLFLTGDYPFELEIFYYLCLKRLKVEVGPQVPLTAALMKVWDVQRLFMAGTCSGPAAVTALRARRKSYGCFPFLVPALLSSHSPVTGTCPNLRVAFPALDSPPCQRCLQPALNLSCLSLGTGRGSECGPGAEPGLSSAGAASAPSPNLNSGDFMESQHH